jgi:cytidylate kinase
VYSVFIDGEAGVGKSTVMAALAEDLARDHYVEALYPGDFFRRITRRLIDEVGLGGTVMPPLDSTVKHILDTKIVYEDGYDWGDLHIQEVDSWVSDVGAVPAVQQEVALGCATQWRACAAAMLMYC